MTLPKLRLPRFRKTARSPDGAMPLRDHLIELRQRIFKALFFLAIGMVVGWFLYPTVLDILKEPYCNLPVGTRYAQPGVEGCQLTYFGPLDGFTLRFKVSGVIGLIVSAPFWLYQLWAFVTPGLRRNERRLTITFVLASTVLFAAGAVLSYLTLPNALKLLTSIAGPSTIAAIEVTRYIGFVMTMLFVFGVSFELPLLVVMLNRIGVLSAKRLMRWQRGAIFLIFVFAAVATPSQDPLSMCMLAVPMVLLYEVAVLIAWFHDRGKARREAADPLHQLSDDEVSEIDLRPSSLDDEVDAAR